MAHNPNYGPEVFEAVLAEKGFVTDIGQIGPELRKLIDKAVKSGRLVKYRGCWDTGTPRFGLLLKTCWTTPAIYNDPENDWFFGRGAAQSEAA